MKVFLNSYGPFSQSLHHEYKKRESPCVTQACSICGRRDSWIEGFEHHIKKRNIEVIHVNIHSKTDRDKIKNNYSDGDYFMATFNEHLEDEWRARFNEVAPVFKKNIFPNQNEVYFYNEKNKERKLFEEKNYRHPKTIYAEHAKDINLRLPLVRKERRGSGSQGVSIVKSIKEIKFPCILQEFCKYNHCDIRINVIGDFVLGFKRENRANDFRASGSGRIVYCNELPSEAVKLAYEISKENDFNCMSYDFVQNSKKEWVVLEISYMFLASAVNRCEFGYDASNNFIKTENKYPAQEQVIKAIGL